MHCCLFAVDTTLSISGDGLAKTAEVFSRMLIAFLDWVKYNQLTINWAKTKVMCISKQRTSSSSYLMIDLI